MDWFKHYADMGEGRSINNLMDEMGHTGLCFFLIQEMCAKKLDLKPHEVGTEADCRFNFHTRVVRERLRLTQAKVERLLSLAQANGLLSYAVAGSSLQIDMPILLDLREKDTRNARNRRAAGVQMPPQEKELELELDKEEELEKNELTNVSSSTALVQMNQPAGPLPVFQDDADCEKLLEEIKHDTQIRWLKIYPDPGYIKREFIKMADWLDRNPKKRPPTVRGLSSFMTSWLNRGWDSYRKQLPTEQLKHKSLEERLADKARARQNAEAV